MIEAAGRNRMERNDAPESAHPLVNDERLLEHEELQAVPALFEVFFGWDEEDRRTKAAIEAAPRLQNVSKNPAASRDARGLGESACRDSNHPKSKAKRPWACAVAWLGLGYFSGSNPGRVTNPGSSPGEEAPSSGLLQFLGSNCNSQSTPAS